MVLLLNPKPCFENKPSVVMLICFLLVDPSLLLLHRVPPNYPNHFEFDPNVPRINHPLQTEMLLLT